jgi:hypothetical protein
LTLRFHRSLLWNPASRGKNVGVKRLIPVPRLCIHSR